MALSTLGITACHCAALSSEIKARSPSKTRDVTGFKSLTNIVTSTPHWRRQGRAWKDVFGLENSLDFFCYYCNGKGIVVVWNPLFPCSVCNSNRAHLTAYIETTSVPEHKQNRKRMESWITAGKKNGDKEPAHTTVRDSWHFAALSPGSELPQHHPGAAFAKPGAAMRFIQGGLLSQPRLPPW